MGFTDTTGAKQQQVLAAVHPAGVVGELLDLVAIQIGDRGPVVISQGLG